MLIVSLNRTVHWVEVVHPDGLRVRYGRLALPREGRAIAVRDPQGRVVGTIRGLDPAVQYRPPGRPGPIFCPRVGFDLPRSYRVERSNRPEPGRRAS